MPGPVRVAYIVRSWPRLSQTFIVNEIVALERLGLHISLFALARSDEAVVQPQVGDVAAPVGYLDQAAPPRAHLRLAVARPWRYLTTVVFALTSPRLRGGYTQSTALGAFARAVTVAAELDRQRRVGRPATHVHAHFAHDPALIGLLVHRLTGLPFSFTAHARDLYQIPVPALIGRVREASAVITCCQANVEYLDRMAGGTGAPAQLIYHGVDLEMFRPAQRSEAGGAAVPLIVSVGRLVEKKAFDDLLRALAVAARGGPAFRCRIYGEGPCRQALVALRDELGLGQIVEFPGPRTQRDLVAVYQQADIFALTPRVTKDGDRDGVPNVILEAMACGLPIVSTPVGGISEALSHDLNALLAPANDPVAIAACLEQLLADPGRRRRLGAAGAERAKAFDSRDAARRLAGLFGGSPPGMGGSATPSPVHVVGDARV
jgi:glycosyltransferase involved in cell wall biosynthesis